MKGTTGKICYWPAIRRLNDPPKPSIVERATEWWDSLPTSVMYVFVGCIIAAVFIAALIVFCTPVSAAPLHFDFAETPQPPKTLISGLAIFDLGPAMPQPDRRCSLPGEREACTIYCGRLGGIQPIGRPWTPVDPTVVFTPNWAVRSCDVRTINGHMTLVCECMNPGNEV